MLPHEFDFQASLNQAPVLADYNSFTTHAALQQAVKAYGGGWAMELGAAFGAVMGSRQMIQAGELANKYGPVLKTHDRFGNRLDVVEYHPAYHEMMTVAIRYGFHSIAWTELPGAYVAHSLLA